MCMCLATTITKSKTLRFISYIMNVMVEPWKYCKKEIFVVEIAI